MAIPFDPTVASICRTALRRSGQPSPSSGMIEDAIANQFQEVKNDIKLNAATHPLLETKEIGTTTVGRQEQTIPTTANIVTSVMLFDGPDAWRTTLTAGTTSTWTQPTSFDEDDETIIGKPIFTLSGTGLWQYSYIIAYNNSSKNITVSPAVTTAPSSNTGVLIANYRHELYNSSRQLQLYDRYSFATKGLPQEGSISGETLYLDRGPDKRYALMWTYYKDIDQLTESDSAFTKVLREWRNIFIEGVTLKSMILYDDNRQYEHVAIYKYMLDRLASESSTICQTVPYDPVYQ